MNNRGIYGVASCDSDPEADFFERHNECIKAAARKVIPRGFSRKREADITIDDLEQHIRCKLLRVLRKKHSIDNPPAYIYSVATTSAIDMLRRYKELDCLPVDEYGELSQDQGIGAISAIPQDPAWICEINEATEARLKEVARATSTLPRHQRRAFICYLHEQLDDVRPLVRMLKALGCEVESVNWPAEQKEAHNLKASVSIARKKVRQQLEESVMV